MAEAWDGTHWFMSLLPALGVAAVWTAVLAAFATPLTTTRKAYQYGLAAAVFAYVVVIGVMSALAVLFPDAPRWIVSVLVPPLVEEISRMLGVVEVRRRTDWRGWISFGVGYGLLEAGLKLGDGLVLLARSGAGAIEFIARVLIPFVPLLLHMFLSVAVFALLRKGVPLGVALIVAMLFHALHNWSALAFVPTDWVGVLLLNLVRCASFAALIAVAIRLSRRTAFESPGATG